MRRYTQIIHNFNIRNFLKSRDNTCKGGQDMYLRLFSLFAKRGTGEKSTVIYKLYDLVKNWTKFNLEINYHLKMTGEASAPTMSKQFQA